jgi:hypothetical protein
MSHERWQYADATITLHILCMAAASHYVTALPTRHTAQPSGSKGYLRMRPAHLERKHPAQFPCRLCTHGHIPCSSQLLYAHILRRTFPGAHIHKSIPHAARSSTLFSSHDAAVDVSCSLHSASLHCTLHDSHVHSLSTARPFCHTVPDIVCSRQYRDGTHPLRDTMCCKAGPLTGTAKQPDHMGAQCKSSHQSAQSCAHSVLCTLLLGGMKSGALSCSLARV